VNTSFLEWTHHFSNISYEVKNKCTMISKHSVKIHQYLTWFLGWFVGQNSNKIFSFFYQKSEVHCCSLYSTGIASRSRASFFMILRSNDIASWLYGQNYRFCRRCWNTYPWTVQSSSISTWRRPILGQPKAGLGNSTHSLRTPNWLFRRRVCPYNRRNRRRWWLWAGGGDSSGRGKRRCSSSRGPAFSTSKLGRRPRLRERRSFSI